MVVLGFLAALALGQGDALGLRSLVLPDVAFLPRERAVSDWRGQAASGLDASAGTRLSILLGRDPRSVTRCVRLNNYWCIKRGGWSGEIAADREGHVAFASAFEGATVAALLLRRYYVDYGRHSALAIVSHWAPAACGVAPAPRRGGSSGPFARTLRGRWLAAHRRGAAGSRRGRPSAVPDRLIGAALPSPTIALGVGVEPAPRAASIDLSAAVPAALIAAPGPLPPPAPACGGDAARIAGYAARAAAGIAGSATADLALFDAAGRPTPHLARLMRNMAAVEIGPLGADGTLVERAVAHAAEVVAARARVAVPTPAAAVATAGRAGPIAAPGRGVPRD